MISIALVSLHDRTGFPPREEHLQALLAERGWTIHPARPLLSRAQSVCARLALERLLAPHPLDLSALAADATGRPRLLPTPGLPAPPDLSLTHDGSLAASAVSYDAPVGLDLQKIPGDPAKCLALAKRYFPTEEYDRLRNAPPDRLPGAFALLWTRKEAAVKRTGAGLSALSATSGRLPPPGAAFHSWRLTAPDGTYYLSLCAPAGIPVRLLPPDPLNLQIEKETDHDV